jgi:hypothetical protein
MPASKGLARALGARPPGVPSSGVIAVRRSASGPADRAAAAVAGAPHLVPVKHLDAGVPQLFANGVGQRKIPTLTCLLTPLQHQADRVVGRWWQTHAKFPHEPNTTISTAPDAITVEYFDALSTQRLPQTIALLKIAPLSSLIAPIRHTLNFGRG